MKTSSNNNIVIFTIGTLLALIILYVIKDFLGKPTPSGPVIPNIPFSPIEPSKIVQPTNGQNYYISQVQNNEYLGFINDNNNEVVIVDEKVSWKYTSSVKDGETVSSFFLTDSSELMYIVNNQSGTYIKTIVGGVSVPGEIYSIDIGLIGTTPFYGYLFAPSEYVKNGVASFFIRYTESGSVLLPIDESTDSDRFRFTEVEDLLIQ